MTWHKWMIEQLTSRGLFPEHAHLIVNRYVLDGAGEAMADRMSDDMEGYPIQIKAGVLLGLKDAALEWIDENLPQHFARPMFEPTEPQHGG